MSPIAKRPADSGVVLPTPPGFPPPPAEAASIFARLAIAPGRTAVMGVLNLTPDSFFEGSRVAAETALARAGQMISHGAAILDLGAESTRPYGDAIPVAADEEVRRLGPLSEIVALGTPVSIDTMKAPVARWALERGAAIVNDVWGLQRDPDMARVVADHDAVVVVMHNRAEVSPEIDLMSDVMRFFERSLEIADRAGLRRDRIVIDPGIGFGKTPQQSFEALARLADLKAFGRPILVGASRKRFIASVSPSDPSERLGGALAAHLIAARSGASFIRAHDVRETVQALRVAETIEDAGWRIRSS
jgi:dihydropteroate synthase